MIPLKLKPALKDYIWGGNRLPRVFGIDSPFDKTAEAWMLSCHPDGENIIENGAYAGRTLSDVLAHEGKAYCGTKSEAFDFFPVARIPASSAPFRREFACFAYAVGLTVFLGCCIASVGLLGAAYAVGSSPF